MSLPNGRRAATLAALALSSAGFGIAACVDTRTPSGPSSISLLQFPSPSVVLDDVMRDSAGNPAPLRARVFDGFGVELTDAAVVLTSLDPSIRIDPDGTITGLSIDSVGARVVATVNGFQTPVARVFVTYMPDTITGGGTTAVLTFPPTTPQSPLADSIVQSVQLAATVLSAEGRGSHGIIVHYELLASPESQNPQLPTTFIGDDARRHAPRDTTDVRGTVSRRVFFLHRRAAGAVGAGGEPDTIVVRATARYAGAELAGSPVIFKIPVRMQ